MLRIGDIEIEPAVVQAALSGYSDLAMRRVARAHGARFALHEVVLDKNVLVRGKSRRRILEVHDDDHPVGGQLMGAEPQQFGAAAADMVAAGYDLIDINFGCPVPRVLGRCRGGYLLSQPADALAIVGKVVEAVADRVPVTVKLRRGLDDSAESERAFFEILDGAFARGIAAVTVHGRTVRQKYRGGADWDFLARVKRHLGDRVMIGSGDLFSPYAIRDMLARTGADGASAARGAIGNPWIFAQTAELLAGRPPMLPTVTEQRRAIEMHREAASKIYSEVRALGSARRHAIKFARWHPEPVAVRRAFVDGRTRSDFDRVLSEWYGSAGADARRVVPCLRDPLPATADG